MSSILQKYQAYILLEKGLSPNTRQAYSSDVEKLLDFLADEGIDLLQTTLDDLHRFAASLYDGGNYAYGSAAMCLDCLADGVHQADVAAAEYQRMPVVSHPPPHLLSCREEVGVYVVVGRTENSNFHNAFCRCMY